MMKRLLSGGIVLAAILVLSANVFAVGDVPGTWVKAIPADFPNGNTVEADTNDPNWYSGPDATTWNPPTDQWYLWAGNGGIGEDGSGGWNDLEHYCIYNGNFNPPTIKTIITGLIPGETYRIRILYGVTSTPGNGGVWAGLGPNTTDWTWYNSLNGIDTGLWVPGRTGGVGVGDQAPSQYAILGDVEAVGGQITVWVGYGQTTFYDGLTYDSDLVTTCIEAQNQGLITQMVADINNDCYVNMEDFAQFTLEWLQCNDPDDQLCEHPWLNP